MLASPVVATTLRVEWEGLATLYYPEPLGFGQPIPPPEAVDIRMHGKLMIDLDAVMASPNLSVDSDGRLWWTSPPAVEWKITLDDPATSEQLWAASSYVGACIAWCTLFWDGSELSFDGADDPEYGELQIAADGTGTWGSGIGPYREGGGWLYGQVLSSTIVIPEPTSFVLFVAGTLLMLRSMSRRA